MAVTTGSVPEITADRKGKKPICKGVVLGSNGKPRVDPGYSGVVLGSNGKPRMDSPKPQDDVLEKGDEPEIVEAAEDASEALAKLAEELEALLGGEPGESGEPVEPVEKYIQDVHILAGSADMAEKKQESMMTKRTTRTSEAWRDEGDPDWAAKRAAQAVKLLEEAIAEAGDGPDGFGAKAADMADQYHAVLLDEAKKPAPPVQEAAGRKLAAELDPAVQWARAVEARLRALEGMGQKYGDGEGMGMLAKGAPMDVVRRKPGTMPLAGPDGAKPGPRTGDGTGESGAEDVAKADPMPAPAPAPEPAPAPQAQIMPGEVELAVASNRAGKLKSPEGKSAAKAISSALAALDGGDTQSAADYAGVAMEALASAGTPLTDPLYAMVAQAQAALAPAQPAVVQEGMGQKYGGGEGMGMLAKADKRDGFSGSAVNAMHRASILAASEYTDKYPGLKAWLGGEGGIIPETRLSGSDLAKLWDNYGDSASAWSDVIGQMMDDIGGSFTGYDSARWMIAHVNSLPDSTSESRSTEFKRGEGFQTKISLSDTMECPECGAETDANRGHCPECGCIVEKGGGAGAHGWGDSAGRLKKAGGVYTGAARALNEMVLNAKFSDSWRARAEQARDYYENGSVGDALSVVSEIVDTVWGALYKDGVGGSVPQVDDDNERANLKYLAGTARAAQDALRNELPEDVKKWWGAAMDFGKPSEWRFKSEKSAAAPSDILAKITPATVMAEMSEGVSARDVYLDMAMDAVGHLIGDDGNTDELDEAIEKRWEEISSELPEDVKKWWGAAMDFGPPSEWRFKPK